MGIVTKIKLRLHDVSDVLTGIMIIPETPEYNTWSVQYKTAPQSAGQSGSTA